MNDTIKLPEEFFKVIQTASAVHKEEWDRVSKLHPDWDHEMVDFDLCGRGFSHRAVVDLAALRHNCSPEVADAVYAMRRAWPEAVRMVNQRSERLAYKCSVRDCENHTDQGSFVGEFCTPCYRYITKGEGKFSQVYRNTMSDVKDGIAKAVHDYLAGVKLG